ncbi:MAG: dTDP-4-dehydrorhamnose 3,5-epimerase [Campylobacterales bacterium]|nr:dTDP-4-dehydrorhamnose 3,5-epimerase [Campylobacterales bacterium]
MSRFDILNSVLNGVYILNIKQLSDDRGFFERLFCKEDFKDIGLKKEIVQINRSCTKKVGSIRGMHYQQMPKSETKIIRCLKGEVLDVAVDLRENSPTFLKYHAEILSEYNNKIIVIPEGFAHGFQVLKEDSELLYFHTEYYSPQADSGVRFDDPSLDIQWLLEPTEISLKDKNYKLIDENFKGVII